MIFPEDAYKTIKKPEEGEVYKEKGSKFLGFAFPIADEEGVKELVNQIKKVHYTARHWCYAWQLGVENVQYRVNDDGEPHNSAGQPIYGQIQSFGLTNILVVVVRYYGGVKLGVGGLISAYKIAAQNVLEQAEIVEMFLEELVSIKVSYEALNKLMRFIREQKLTINNQFMNLDCEIQIKVRKSELEELLNKLSELHYLKSFKIN